MPRRHSALLMLALLSAGACAARGPQRITDRFVHQGEPAMHFDESEADAAARKRAGEATRAETARALAAAVPPERVAPPTLEREDRGLAEALDAWRAGNTAAAARRVAEAYRRRGVLDVASEYYALALRHDPADAAAWDGMARIWRDSGLPHLGLGDAQRAVYYAPASAAVHNTLGTVLMSLGRWSEARTSFTHALALDPGATWAAGNLERLDRLQAPADESPSANR